LWDISAKILKLKVLIPQKSNTAFEKTIFIKGCKKVISHFGLSAVVKTLAFFSPSKPVGFPSSYLKAKPAEKFISIKFFKIAGSPVHQTG